MPFREAVDGHRIAPDAAPDEACPARLFGVKGLLAEPRLESEGEEGGAGSVLRRRLDPSVLAKGRPVTALSRWCRWLSFEFLCPIIRYL